MERPIAYLRSERFCKGLPVWGFRDNIIQIKCPFSEKMQRDNASFYTFNNDDTWRISFDKLARGGEVSVTGGHYVITNSEHPVLVAGCTAPA